MLVTISSCYKDVAHDTQIYKHLSFLRRENLIQFTEDLNDAEIILCLISENYLKIYAETIEHIMRIRTSKPGTIVVPVILDNCNWSNTGTGIEKLQYTPYQPVAHFANLDEAFLEVAKDLRCAVTKTPEEILQIWGLENLAFCSDSDERAKKD